MTGKYELHHYWNDGVTIACRYFNTRKAAKKYAVDNGLENYKITKNLDVSKKCPIIGVY